MRGEDDTQSISFQIMKCVDWRGEHYIKKLKKKSKAKKPSKSTYNPLLQVDYPLFKKSVPIGFVLLSIPTTIQNLRKIRRKVYEEIA